MSPQEAEDLARMKAEMAKCDAGALGMMELFVKYTPEELAVCGYKTLEEALKRTVLTNLRAKQKLANDHTKKYPD